MNVDPNLLPAGATPAEAQRVSPLNAKTAEIPLEFTETAKAYICTVSAASLYRKDGKKIPFVFGFHETKVKGDIDYLEAEIAGGNQFIRHATQQEIEAAHMRLNPRETIRDQVLQQEIPVIKESLRAELLKELEAKGVDVSALLATDAAKNDASKIAGTKVTNASELLAKVKGAAVATPPVPVLGGIQGTDKIAAAAANGTVASVGAGAKA